MTERKIASSAFSFCKRCVGSTSCLVWEIEPRKLGTILSIQVSSSGKTTTAAQIWRFFFFILNRRRETTWDLKKPPVIFAWPRVAQAEFVNMKRICTKARNWEIETLAMLSVTNQKIYPHLQRETLNTVTNTFMLVSSYGRQKSVFTNPLENHNV